MKMGQNFYLQLVSPDNPVTMVPESKELIPVYPNFPEILLERYAAHAVQALLHAIGAEGKIVPVSGFRTLREQQEIWDSALKEHGLVYTKKYVAIPGCSEHQTGLAIDLALNQEEIDFICPAFPDEGICRQFQDLAPKYGLILRYPKGKEPITHIGWEPWHFRYVGTPHAEIMTKHQIVLEEYLSYSSAQKACGMR